MKRKIDRRRVLRGMLNGAAVTVGLPLLDVFLNPNGDALADSEPMGKRELPLIFGTFFWPLGLSPSLWEPKKVGAGFEINDHLKGLKPIEGKFNIYSGTEVFLDGKTLQVHYSPPEGIITGEVSTTGSSYGQSLDQTIAEHLGSRSRFQSISFASDGNAQATWSSRGSSAGMNPSEISPLALYTKLFGPGFVDPNAAEFMPDPAIMIQKSALSAVTEQRRELMRLLGASDRARLDSYFTSVRDMERKLALELVKPEPLAACSVPPAPKDFVSKEIDAAVRTHDQFIKLIAHALACGQARVFNDVISLGVTSLHIAGDPEGNHSHTHQEPIDPKLGYQPVCKGFADRYMACFSDLVKELESIKEGGGTLLDRTLLMAFTDHGEARRHTAKAIPMLTAGTANGRVKTGLHVAAQGQTSCRLGLTCLQAMGLPISTWGAQSNRTDSAFTEVLT